jgi:hypothetical protein
MKKLYPLLLASVLIFSACSQAATSPLKDLSATEPPEVEYDPVEAYAVLAEKDDYQAVGMTDLLVDYIDIERMRAALEALGWDPQQIHDLKEFDRESLQEELDWLKGIADANDLVFFYITGHGTFLRENISWNSFFPEEWAQIPSPQRVLVVDSCTAAEFTRYLKSDPNPQLAIAAVDADEYGWKGLEEEGLPIVGGVFTFYFADALGELEADADGDGKVSVQEAALFAEEKQRSYMHEVVFGVSEFLESYHDIGVKPDQDDSFPDVIIDDTLGEDIFLELGD